MKNWTLAGLLVLLVAGCDSRPAGPAPSTDARVTDPGKPDLEPVTRPPAASCPGVAAPTTAGETLKGAACSTAKLRCTYVIDDCGGQYLPVEWVCECNGSSWSCSRGYDCPRDWQRDAGVAPSID
jgi:hypothetical protein